MDLNNYCYDKLGIKTINKNSLKHMNTLCCKITYSNIKDLFGLNKSNSFFYNNKICHVVYYQFIYMKIIEIDTVIEIYCAKSNKDKLCSILNNFDIKFTE